MNLRGLLFFLLIFPAFTSLAQYGKTQVTPSPESIGSGINSTSNKHISAISPSADGYIVYKHDTIRGLIMLSQTEVNLEHPENEGESTYYTIKFKDRNLQTIMMYNYDKKPLCLTRVKNDDKKLRRLLHEGKLNVYDDRAGYVYKPGDIDAYLIIVSYNGIVDDLGSFSGDVAKRDLIGYINDIYGLKINPRNTGWSELLRTLDGLD